MAIPLCSDESTARWNWKVGDVVEVHSDSRQRWFSGEIVGVCDDDEGEWLQVRYAKSLSKQIQRFAAGLRPTKEQMRKHRKQRLERALAAASDRSDGFDESEKETTVRESWKKGDYLEIFSNTLDQWRVGQVSAVSRDSDGEWLDCVWHTEDGSAIAKLVDRFCVDVRPLRQGLERRSMAISEGYFSMKELLDSVPLLSSLNKSQKQEFAKGLVKRVFEKGSALMVEGDEGDLFYVIVQGKVEVRSESDGLLAELGQGDYVGEQSLLKSAVRNATVRAVQRTTCLACDKKTFDKVLASTVRFAKREGKRKAFLSRWKSEDAKLDVADEKPPETVAWLLQCVAENLLFVKLDTDQRRAIVLQMHIVSVELGNAIISEGEEGTTFYVTEKGEFDVVKDGVTVDTCIRGDCFGELALLYDSPRTASLVANCDSSVWEVSREVFRYQLREVYKKKADEDLAFLTTVELLKPLKSEELQLVAQALDKVEYEKDEVVISEGADGDKFYIISEGVAVWSKSNGQFGELGTGMYFGEAALRTKEKRSATVAAKSAMILLEMSAKDFHNLLGPVLKVVDAGIEVYHKRQGTFEEEMKVAALAALSLESSASASEVLEAVTSEPMAAASTGICELSELLIIGLLGAGTFGRVSLCEDPYTGKSYALKAIRKQPVVEWGSQRHVVAEKRLMEKMHCKFLVNLHRTYKDPLRVYLLMDVCLGGELFAVLRSWRYFEESTARFYAASVVQAFDYMHAKNIVYRDLKPENLVLDTSGYLRVTDFGLAKELLPSERTFTSCGTPDYLAPEVITGRGHGRAVDWWTLGILIYEMLASFPPFFDDDPMETCRKIIRAPLRFPLYSTPEACDLVRNLLKRRPTQRLGILKGGASRIRRHKWFKSFRWKKLNDGSMKAPIVNPVTDHRDLSNFFNSERDKKMEVALPIKPEDDFDDEF